MNIKRVVLLSAVAAACRAAVVLGCTSWVIMPERSASGRMIVHKCRDQHLNRLTAVIRTDGGVRWMCIGADGGAMFELNEYGVAATSNYGGKYMGRRRKAPKHRGGILENIAERAKSAEAAAAFVRRCGRAGWRANGGMFLVADAKRAFAVEVGPGYGEMMEIPGGMYVISNSLHLGGCEAYFHGKPSTLCRHREREANTRAELQKNRVDGKYTLEGIFRSSRLAGGRAPFNKYTLSAVCFELDAEFPEMLGCAYVALGPQRHTVYLPTPMALEQFPEDMQNGKWAARALALRMKLGDRHPYLPRIEALEKELVAEFSAVREEALALLRAGRRDEAKKLLNDTFARHYARAKELLRRIAEEAGVDPDPPILTRQDEAQLHRRIIETSTGSTER